MSVKNYSRSIAGRDLKVQFGKLAQQASGSCVVQYGETMVLVTATMGAHVKPVDYFPLSVEYEEKYYAAGKIKGSKWLKREGRPSEEAILTARMIDRAIRPRFDMRVRHDVQIVATVLSFDGVNDPDVPALFGASMALMVSNIKFDGPVAAARVCMVNGEVVTNPTYAQRKESTYDIIVAGTAEKINMLEAGAKIVAEKDIVHGISAGFDMVKELNAFQTEISKEFNTEKKHLDLPEHDKDLVEIVRKFATPKLDVGLYTPDKQTFYKNLKAIKDELHDHIREKYEADPRYEHKMDEAMQLFELEIDRVVHKNILEKEKRPDGRKVDQLRALESEVATLPQSHGSGLFNRGSTQALSILTLAAPGLEQWIETMEIDLTKKRFMHHYVFPPFSVGETGRMGAPGRRDIGHGALAERSLEPIIPNKADFPYTIRVVSEILSSNGSSSMASVCGASLALMDGGVPIKTPAAGIAMGLMFDEKNEKYKILTDIQGPEDHHGDMDMKVAGTSEGVTGMQMDVKVDGITVEILEKTLMQARKARLEILASITKAIPAPRAELSPNAPRVQTVMIDPEKIGALIGPGGKMINAIIEETGAQIDIEDDGSVFVTSVTAEGMAKAMKLIKQVTYEPKAGEEFDGEVVSIRDFGAFVQIMPGRDGMVHVSEMSEGRVEHPSDVLKLGQKVHVWIKSMGDDGKISLSMLGPEGKSGGGHGRFSGGRPPRRDYDR